MQDKKYGYFDDARREYVITDPRTPWPWINYLGNEDFFSLISNTAGGYSFYKDAKFRRITRYRYNSVPMDNGGRYFYIKDGETVWSPGWKPCKTPLDSYECRHGMSYTRITGAKNGVEASVLFFVPLKTWAEVQKLTLRNTGDATKRLKLFSFAEWCLWNAATDMENFQRNFSTGEVEVDGSVIYHKTEYKERRNHYAYYSVNVPIQGFDTDRETFIGLYNEFAVKCFRIFLMLCPLNGFQTGNPQHIVGAEGTVGDAVTLVDMLAVLDPQAHGIGHLVLLDLAGLLAGDGDLDDHPGLYPVFQFRVQAYQLHGGNVELPADTVHRLPLLHRVFHSLLYGLCLLAG